MTGHNANDMATRDAAQEAVMRGPLSPAELRDLLPAMQKGWTIETYATWSIRAAERAHGIATAAPVTAAPEIDVDALAQEIRRVDGTHSLGAGALAEALVEWLSRHVIDASPKGGNEISNLDHVDDIGVVDIQDSPKGGSDAIDHAGAALAHLSNALDDLQYSPDQRPVPLIREAMWHLQQMQATSHGAGVSNG